MELSSNAELVLWLISDESKSRVKLGSTKENNACIELSAEFRTNPHENYYLMFMVS